MAEEHAPARGGALAGLRRLPLHDRHVAAGARLAPFAGWAMPLQYPTGILAEHAAVRETAGVFDVSHMGRVRVEGPDAAERIRAVTTFDVTRLRPGRAHYSLYCTPGGGIADDVFVYRLDAERWLIVHNAANAHADAERLRAAVADADGAAMRDVGGETVMLAVQGPVALARLGTILGVDLAVTLAPRRCTEVAWRDERVLVGRTGYTGEDGAECVLGPDAGAALWDACLAAGVAPAGLGARDTLRLEAALPLHGQDITPETDPLSAGLGWAVTIEDGAAFTGRAALEEAAARPAERRLTCLRLRDRGVPRLGYAVRAAAGGEGGSEQPVVATLTSGAFSPTLHIGIAMAYLPVALTAPGTRLAIEIRGRDVDAEVVPRPFYRRAG